jgi:hypothetical protein
MIILLLLAVAVAMLAVAGYYLRGGDDGDEPVVHRANCPRCDQRVRYTADDVGLEIICPRCRRRWTLPRARVRGRELPQQQGA